MGEIPMLVCVLGFTFCAGSQRAERAQERAQLGHIWDPIALTRCALWSEYIDLLDFA